MSTKYNMSLNKYKQNICRICFEDNLLLDWNTSLYQFHDITYKDCYYKYSQLERYATDPFTQMLCQNCCNALDSTHTLILKILESHNVLQSTLSFDNQFQEEFIALTGNSNSLEYTPIKFETVLVEKIDDHFLYDGNSDDDIKVKCEAPIIAREQTKGTIAVNDNVNAEPKREQSVKTKNKLKKLGKESCNSFKINKSQAKSKRNALSKAVTGSNNNSKIIIEKEISEGEQSNESNLNAHYLVSDNKILEDEPANAEPKFKKKYIEKKNPSMCSICSKILHNKYATQMHEKTHIENRERKETCNVCGLKFYDKRNLYSHMLRHKENREKRHKCEFCSKAFYDKGGLNIHRRIHLGQMIPCNLCSKQFFRQIDLERHMSTHAATTINSDIKKRSRYFVRCQYCDKSIRSISFKSHTAAHLNEPLMKCSICDKEFFRRYSCVLHVKKVHQKNNDEYNDFIILYKKNRISHLFLEQKADIQVQSD